MPDIHKCEVRCLFYDIFVACGASVKIFVTSQQMDDESSVRSKSSAQHRHVPYHTGCLSGPIWASPSVSAPLIHSSSGVLFGPLQLLTSAAICVFPWWKMDLTSFESLCGLETIARKGFREDARRGIASIRVISNHLFCNMFAQTA